MGGSHVKAPEEAKEEAKGEEGKEEEGKEEEKVAEKIRPDMPLKPEEERC